MPDPPLEHTRGRAVAGTAWRLQLASSERQDKMAGGGCHSESMRFEHLVAGLRAARLSVMDGEAVPDTLSAAALLDLKGMRAAE